MKLSTINISVLICTVLFSANVKIFAQNFDISSGGQPTITGALNGSVSGTTDVTQNLVVNINFGEVSPANPNPIVKVIVPIAIRSKQPYQVSVAISGGNISSAQAIQFSDIGYGNENMHALGNKARICSRSSHIFYSPFNRDPATTATINSSGRVAYQSTIANITGSTVILSGPELTQGTSSSRSITYGWAFDAIFVITPQFFSASLTSATLTFTISPGPNVPC